MNNRSRIKRIPLILVVLLFACFTTIPVFAETGTSPAKEIDIVTTPDKVFFDLHNIKPGDWAVRTIVVKNSGSQDFNYIVTAERNTGSKKLYEGLELTIADANGELYHGSLGDFNKLEARPLAKNESEELEFTIKFPEELGNEYQGLSTEVNIKFYAEGTLGGLLPPDGPKLPNTSTNNFNTLLAGVVLLGGSSILYFVRKKLTKVE